MAIRIPSRMKQRRYGYVHVETVEPEPPVAEYGWDSSKATTESSSTIAVSADRRTLTNPGYFDFNGCIALPSATGASKIYVEVVFGPDGGNTTLFPAYIGLIANNLALEPPSSGVVPEDASVAFAMLLQSNGETEYYASGSPAGFYPIWGDYAAGDNQNKLMLAFDVDAGTVHVGQGGVWIVGPPSDAAVSFDLGVAGSNLLLYAWNVVNTTGAFTAADLSYALPIGYTAWDGTGESAEITYAGSTNIVIPDNNLTGVSDTIVVPTSYTMADSYLDISITHPRLEDLIVTVTHNAQEVLVLNQVAGVNYTDRITMLYDITGDAQGDWVLTAKDVVSGQTGTVNSWSITLLPAP